MHGTLVAGLPVFMSVPYAHASRWGHPQSPAQLGTCWSGTLDATAYGPQCITLLAAAYPWLRTEPYASEDCLSLTIWGADISAADTPLPVMVFFHSGDLTFGDAKTNFSLLQQSGVVVVDVSCALTD